MSNLTTVRQEAQAALTQLGTDLAAAKTVVTTIEGQLAEAVAKVSAIGLEHAAVSAMIEGGRVVQAVEQAGATIVADVKTGFSKAEKLFIKGAAGVGGVAGLGALAKSLGLLAFIGL